MEPLCFKFCFSHIAKQNKKSIILYDLFQGAEAEFEARRLQNSVQHTGPPGDAVDVRGPRKAVVGYKIAPNRFKTTYRSVLTFEEKSEAVYYSLV